MIVNTQNLSAVFTGFKKEFQAGFAGIETTWGKLATRVPSSTEQELYGWLNDFPAFREWLGSRHIKDLKAEDYSLTNRLWESTVSVPRVKFDDDTFGTFGTIMRELGAAAARHADELVYTKLIAGDTDLCYDGQAFFAAAHPVGSSTAANIDTGGSNNVWYLFDTSRALKPLIYQQREAAQLVQKTNPETSDDVFMQDRFLYGGRSRDVAGFGFWQTAFCSDQAIDTTYLNSHIATMMAYTSDNGTKLGIMPTLLVCGPSNRAAAKVLLEAQYLASGATNTDFRTVDVLVTPYLT
jgi:phage major head subunit gpT-like protein